MCFTEQNFPRFFNCDGRAQADENLNTALDRRESSYQVAPFFQMRIVRPVEALVFPSCAATEKWQDRRCVLIAGNELAAPELFVHHAP